MVFPVRISAAQNLACIVVNSVADKARKPPRDLENEICATPFLQQVKNFPSHTHYLVYVHGQGRRGKFRPQRAGSRPRLAVFSTAKIESSVLYRLTYDQPPLTGIYMQRSERCRGAERSRRKIGNFIGQVLRSVIAFGNAITTRSLEQTTPPLT